MAGAVRPSGLALTVVVALLLLPGCSVGPRPYVDVAPPQTAAERAGSRCPRDGFGLGVNLTHIGPGPTPGVLPATFRPNRARLCRVTDAERRVTKGGQRYTVAEETAPVTDELLTVLALPDQGFAPRDHSACGLVYTPPVYFLLVDPEGEAFRPHLPASPCGGPRQEVQRVLDSLPFTSRTTYPVLDPR